MPLSKLCAGGCRRLVSVGTERCEACKLPPYGRPHRRASAPVMANATACHLCGQGPWPDDINPRTKRHDPMTADHRLPRKHGGKNERGNYAPAHRSCNSRKGAKL